MCCCKRWTFSWYFPLLIQGIVSINTFAIRIYAELSPVLEQLGQFESFTCSVGSVANIKRSQEENRTSRSHIDYKSYLTRHFADRPQFAKWKRRSPIWSHERLCLFPLPFPPINGHHCKALSFLSLSVQREITSVPYRSNIQITFDILSSIILHNPATHSAPKNL